MSNPSQTQTANSKFLRRAAQVATLDVHPALHNTPKNVLQVDEHKQRWGAIAEVGRGLLVPSGRHETFGEAVKRLGVDEAHLERRRHELVIESRIMNAGSFFSIAMALLFTETLFAAVMASALAACFAMQGASRSIWVRQIDVRRMEGFWPWLKSPEYWLV